MSRQSCCCWVLCETMLKRSIGWFYRMSARCEAECLSCWFAFGENGCFIAWFRKTKKEKKKSIAKFAQNQSSQCPWLVKAWNARRHLLMLSPFDTHNSKITINGWKNIFLLSLHFQGWSGRSLTSYFSWQASCFCSSLYAAGLLKPKEAALLRAKFLSSFINMAREEAPLQFCSRGVGGQTTKRTWTF